MSLEFKEFSSLLENVSIYGFKVGFKNIFACAEIWNKRGGTAWIYCAFESAGLCEYYTRTICLNYLVILKLHSN